MIRKRARPPWWVVASSRSHTVLTIGVWWKVCGGKSGDGGGCTQSEPLRSESRSVASRVATFLEGQKTRSTRCRTAPARFWGLLGASGVALGAYLDLCIFAAACRGVVTVWPAATVLTLLSYCVARPCARCSLAPLLVVRCVPTLPLFL